MKKRNSRNLDLEYQLALAKLRRNLAIFQFMLDYGNLSDHTLRAILEKLENHLRKHKK